MEVFLLLGTNMGERAAQLQRALSELATEFGPPACVSAIYETAAWGLKEQAPFLNQAAIFESSLSAEEILKRNQAIELQMGRIAAEKWGPRAIDIDILFIGETMYESAVLQVPHPFIGERRFTLVPLAEIAGNFLHPVKKKTIAELLVECPDESRVKRWEEIKSEI